MSAVELYTDGPLSTGVPEIDADHARLHGIAADLDSILLTNAPVDLRLQKYTILYNAFTKHFASEEHIMAELGVESLNTHKKMHNELLKQLSRLGESIAVEHNRIVTDKFFAVEKLLIMHIASMDTDIRHYVK
jgi:hemerythrin-like metal-binding protein